MMLGWRAKIGQIRPATSIEGAEEWRTVAPVGVHFADARTIVPQVDAKGLAVMMDQVVEAARQLATAKVDLIVQCGAPGIFLKGVGEDERVTGQIKQATGIPAITMMGAMTDALKALGAQRIAVATIYTEEVNRVMTRYLEAMGFQVKAMRGLQIDDPFAVSHEEPDGSYRAGRAVHKVAGEVDAILLSCGAWRTFEVLHYLEMDTGVPVVSSNQASLWRALRFLGLRDVVPQLGRLFTLH
jgi:maleate cis-trans isomerase